MSCDMDGAGLLVDRAVIPGLAGGGGREAGLRQGQLGHRGKREVAAGIL